MRFSFGRANQIAASMLVAAALAVAATPRAMDFGATPKPNLEAMVPSSLGEWSVDQTIVPIAPSPELRAVVEKTYDQTLSRTYVDRRGYRIMLSIAYGGRQTQGMNTHRPEVCYPAQGFQLISTKDDRLLLAGKMIPVRRVSAEQGRRHEPITYWLIVGDQPAYFGIQHRLATLKYGLTGTIPDGMLIRVSSIDTDDEHAFRIHDEFARTLVSGVTEQDRIRLLGALGS